MRIVVSDWETHFNSADYTLKKMTQEEYLRDPRFQAHGCAIKWPGQSARWYDRHQVSAALKAWDWSDTLIVHHHGQFDSAIENWHYDVRPAGIACTLAMARLLLGNHISVSLDSVRAQFGIAPKLTPYHLFDGKYWDDISPADQKLIGEGACDEVESIWKIFQFLAKDFHPEEYIIVDQLIRMFSEPVLIGDIDLLGEVWTDEEKNKKRMMAELGIIEADLQSADKFCALLQLEGIEIEYKPGKIKPNPAVAKTDDFMRGLLEHDNARVAALAAARLGVKSTFMQTRAETLGWKASRGPLTVYLNYCGAGTLRPSGGDKDNWLNFKRKSKIRRAVKAPEGHWIAPVDASQIEFRVCLYLAGQHDQLDVIRNGGDPYIDVASEFYGEQIYKAPKDDPRHDEMEAKRGMGKQGKLMCIYGAAGKQFKATAKNGLYGPPVDMTIEEADRFVQITRNSLPAVCGKGGYWSQAGRMLARLAGGDPIEWGPLLVKDHCIWIEGRPMHYETLQFYRPESDEERATLKDFEQEGYWRMQVRRGKWKKMWGSKLVQNICEGVSRVIVTQAQARIKQKYGIRALNHPYDELLLLIPKTNDAEQILEACKTEMRAPVSWLPGLPLDCEGHLDERYNK